MERRLNCLCTRVVVFIGMERFLCVLAAHVLFRVHIVFLDQLQETQRALRQMGDVL